MPILEHVAQYAGAFLVSGIWQGFVLAVAVGLCLRLVPRTTAALRFAIWAAVLAMIALLPLGAWLEAGHGADTAASSTFSLDVHWSFAIAAVWLAVSCFRAADLLVHGVRLWSLRRRSTPVEAGAVCDVLLAQGTRRVVLCTSTEVDRPSVIGFFAPRILVPAWLFEQLTPAELEQIVLHEMEHLRRGDDWLNLLQKISLILLPLNPIVLWVERRLCFERELACDDGVLRRTGAPRAYASCLTNLAERGLNRRAGLLALGALGAFGAAARESELARRVHRILRRETTLSPAWSRALMACIAVGLVGGAAALARCPQVVSFTEAVQPLQARAVTPVTSSAPAEMASPMVPARLDMPAKAEQVKFKSSSAPHMTLLMDMVQQPTAPSKPRVRKAHRMQPVPEKPAVRRILTNERSQHPPVRNWVVLSSWTEEMRPQVIVPVLIDRADEGQVDGNTVLVPYAAVPAIGGWFLIQL